MARQEAAAGAAMAGDEAAAGGVDEVGHLQRRARRRLIGAAALAMLAAIVLPTVMDQTPAPNGRDIQVRLPDPDVGARPTPQAMRGETAASEMDGGGMAAMGASAASQSRTDQEKKPQPPQTVAAGTDASSPAKADAAAAAKTDDAPPAAAAKAAARTVAADKDAAVKAKDAAASENDEAGQGDRAARDARGEQLWEVRLGAYKYRSSVDNLVNKLGELGVPSFTEDVNTSRGPRTRVRAGPFKSRQEAEDSLDLIRIIGVDGPVARKP